MFLSNGDLSYELIRGDCIDIMSDIPDGSIDMVLCDPPYGIDYQSMWIKDKQKRKKKILNDKVPFLGFISQIKRLLKPTACVMIFTKWTVQQNFIDCMSQFDIAPNSCIIWDKVIHGMGDLKRAYGSRYESVLFHAENNFRFQSKRPTDIVRCNRVSPNSLQHPNEKPIDLLCEFIESNTPPVWYCA